MQKNHFFIFTFKEIWHYETAGEFFSMMTWVKALNLYFIP
jgi:hypothetical protein